MPLTHFPFRNHYSPTRAQRREALLNLLASPFRPDVRANLQQIFDRIAQEAVAQPAPAHQQDQDCTLDSVQSCTTCGVDHSAQCAVCKGRGFHKPGCELFEHLQQEAEARYGS